MIKKTHTRNQRRMYRIHKQEEQIEKDKIIIAEQQIELDKYKKEIEYEQHCNEQLRNKITNLEYKIKRLEEDNKYKEVLDKIKETIKDNFNIGITDDCALEYIYKLLEEIK